MIDTFFTGQPEERVHITSGGFFFIVQKYLQCHSILLKIERSVILSKIK